MSASKHRWNPSLFFQKKKITRRLNHLVNHPSLYLGLGTIATGAAMVGGAFIVSGIFTFGMPIWAAMLCLLSLMSLSILLLSIGFGMICSQMDNEQLDRSNLFIPN